MRSAARGSRPLCLWPLAPCHKRARHDAAPRRLAISAVGRIVARRNGRPIRRCRTARVLACGVRRVLESIEAGVGTDKDDARIAIVHRGVIMSTVCRGVRLGPRVERSTACDSDRCGACNHERSAAAARRPSHFSCSVRRATKRARIGCCHQMSGTRAARRQSHGAAMAEVSTIHHAHWLGAKPPPKTASPRTRSPACTRALSQSRTGEPA